MPQQPPGKRPIDVTDQVMAAGAVLPAPPANIFATSDVVMKGAQDNSYLAHYTEEESKELCNKHFTVTRGMEFLLNYVAHDARFGYEGKVAAVVRHAVELLMTYYLEHNDLFGEHRGWASATLRQQNEARLAQHRAKIRQNFRENIAAYDDEIQLAVQSGDMEFIGGKLRDYKQMLTDAESATQRKALYQTFAQSITTRTAASAFYDWTHNPDRIAGDEWDEKWPALAEEWQTWYEENS